MPIADCRIYDFNLAEIKKAGVLPDLNELAEEDL